MASTIDPTTMAQTLVSAERAAKDQLLSKQATTVENQLSGITSLSTQLTTFQTLLKDLNKISTLQAQSSTLSQEGILSATSNGQAANGQYSFFVQQLAQAHQLSMTFSSEMSGRMWGASIRFSRASAYTGMPRAVRAST